LNNIDKYIDRPAVSTIAEIAMEDMRTSTNVIMETARTLSKAAPSIDLGNTESSSDPINLVTTYSMPKLVSQSDIEDLLEDENKRSYRYLSDSEDYNDDTSDCSGGLKMATFS